MIYLKTEVVIALFLWKCYSEAIIGFLKCLFWLTLP